MMAEYLSDEEHELVKRFIEETSRLFADKEPPSYNVALKFLFARKFDVERSIDLYFSHEQTRMKERLSNINPFRERVRIELISGKFTVLPARDIEGAAIALFTVRLHEPTHSSRTDLLRALLFQLDAAMDSIETQRYGLIFVYDMSESKFYNFDLDVSKKILSLLKDGYPARLRKVLIVNPPVWFKLPFKCLQILLKKKLQERVHMVNANQLALHLPLSSIPAHLGGDLQYDHKEWLKDCLGRNEVQLSFAACDSESFFTNNAGQRRESFRKYSMNSIDSNSSTQQFASHVLWPGLELLGRARERRSVHQQPSRSPGINAQEFVGRVERIGSSGLAKEYAHVKNSPPNSTYNVAKSKENVRKNRYADVQCLDETRVRLLGCREFEDYIHANFVDGYSTSSAYICTQGPLPHTSVDFWRMVWDYHVLVIVMLTKTKESGRVKCDQYWPLDCDVIENYGDLAIINNGVDSSNRDESSVISSLLVQNTRSMEMREVVHMQFVGWPDYGAPNSSENFLNFLLLVRRKQEDSFNLLKSRFPGVPTIPPLLIHCSAGIGRSGTFVAMDVSVERLLRGDGFVDFPGTVEKIRCQRPGSIQTPDQYLFCHTALSHFIKSRGLIDQTSAGRI